MDNTKTEVIQQTLIFKAFNYSYYGFCCGLSSRYN